MIRSLLLIGLLSGTSLCAQSTDAWKPLRCLLGTWEAKTQGGSAGAAVAGDYTFRLELKDHVLARHTLTAACKGPAEYDCEHSDLLYIYGDSAIYFDNEGHVIQYSVTAPRPNTAVFLSSGAGAQYRLTYESKGDVLEGRFEIRAPGKSDFQTYLRWSGKRK